MKPSSSLRARVLCLISAQCFLLPCLASAPAWAQDKVAAAQTTAPGKARPAAPVLISMELKDTSLRQALILLFTNANVQYGLENLPNTSVTLTIRDQPLDNALRLLLQQGSNEGQKLTYTVDAGVYHIRTVPVAAELLRTDHIALSSVRSSDVMGRLQTAFPTSLILPGADATSILVRGSAQQNQEVRELASLLDTAPKTVVLKAEVVMVTYSGSGDAKTASGSKASKASANSGGMRSTLLSTILRTVSGQEATGDDKLMGTPAQSAKLQLSATPVLLGDTTFQVDTRWQVSLPLPTGKSTVSGGKGATIVRLEKLLTTTTRLKNGDTAVVGGVVLNQYGLKGEILFFVTLNVVDAGTPVQGVPGP